MHTDKMSNNFGRMKFHHMSIYGRGSVKSRVSIKISDLTKLGVWEEREILWNKKFKMNNIEMELVQDPYSLDWYIELLNPGPTCNCTTISFITTKCHFGGERYWFECPDTDCLRKVGVLYKDSDRFRCRKCLNLDYESHEINYKSLEPAIKNMHKVNKMIDQYPFGINKFYNGKPTKRTIRFEKLKAKANAGFALFGPRYQKKK